MAARCLVHCSAVHVSSPPAAIASSACLSARLRPPSPQKAMMWWLSLLKATTELFLKYASRSAEALALCASVTVPPQGRDFQASRNAGPEYFGAFLSIE